MSPSSETEGENERKKTEGSQLIQFGNLRGRKKREREMRELIECRHHRRTYTALHC